MTAQCWAHCWIVGLGQVRSGQVRCACISRLRHFAWCLSRSLVSFYLREQRRKHLWNLQEIFCLAAVLFIRPTLSQKRGSNKGWFTLICPSRAQHTRMFATNALITELIRLFSRFLCGSSLTISVRRRPLVSFTRTAQRWICGHK